MRFSGLAKSVAVLSAAGFAWHCGAILAQTPPTATEAFNLRIRCKAMADEKAEALAWHPLTAADGATMGLSPADVEAMNRIHDATYEVFQSWHSSHYEAKTNRCYIEIFLHKRYGRQKENDGQVRQIYDAQTDDLLAFAQMDNGKKVGMVFDHGHHTTTGENLGWDDANAYIEEMMLDQR